MGSQPCNPNLPFENLILFIPGNDFRIHPFCQRSRKAVCIRYISGRFEKRGLPCDFPIRIQDVDGHAADALDVLDVLVGCGRQYGPGDGNPNFTQPGLYNNKLEGPIRREGKEGFNLRAAPFGMGKPECQL